MILVKPSWVLEGTTDFTGKLTAIMKAGATCYKSEPQDVSAFVRKIIKRGHESVIEHVGLTVRFVVDRGVSHELVRHRLAAYSQESTRYCNYGGGVAFIIPPWVGVEPGEYHDETYTMNQLPYADLQWFVAMLNAEAWYKHLLEAKWTPQQARSVLPNSLKTEIVMTANLREWRHVFKLRCAEAAHPQMREVMVPLRDYLALQLPEVFDE